MDRGWGFCVELGLDGVLWVSSGKWGGVLGRVDDLG